MKRWDRWLFGVTFAVHGAVALTELVTWLIGYTVTWTYVTALAAVTTLLTVASVVRLFFLQATAKTTVIALALSGLVVLSLLFLADPSTYWMHMIAMLAAFCGVCRGVSPMWLKIASVIVSLLVYGTLAAAIVVAMLFGVLVTGSPEVMKEIPSPDGAYVAQVVNVSEGALGSDTEVIVRDVSSTVDIGVCVFEKPAQTLATYETYGAYDQITLTWIDNDTVSVYCAGEYDRTTEFDVK